jgi:transposase
VKLNCHSERATLTIACSEIFTSLYDEFGSRAAQYLIGLCTNAPGVSSIICPGCSTVAHVIQLLHNTDRDEKEHHLKQQRSPTVLQNDFHHKSSS